MLTNEQKAEYASKHKFGEQTMSTVLLASGTVGTTATEVAVGETVAVSLCDENGMPITETGRVEEVIE